MSLAFTMSVGIMIFPALADSGEQTVPASINESWGDTNTSQENSSAPYPGDNHSEDIYNNINSYAIFEGNMDQHVGFSSDRMSDRVMDIASGLYHLKVYK